MIELHLYLGMCLGPLLTAFSTVKRNNPPFEMLGHGPRSMPCRVQNDKGTFALIFPVHARLSFSVRTLLSSASSPGVH